METSSVLASSTASLFARSSSWETFLFSEKYSATFLSRNSLVSFTATNKQGSPSKSRVAQETALSSPCLQNAAISGGSPVIPRFARMFGPHVSGYPAGSSNTTEGFEWKLSQFVFPRKTWATPGRVNAKAFRDNGVISESKIERHTSISSETSSDRGES